MNVKALLKNVPSTAYIYATVALLVVGAYNGWAYHIRQDGKRDLLIAQHERTEKQLRHDADSLRGVYRTDTLRLTKYRLRTDSLTTTVELWKHDTLRVVEYVAKADTAIKACVQALQTCDQRVAVAQRGWDGARAENALLKKNQPSRATPYVWGIAGIGIGYLARTVIK